MVCYVCGTTSRDGVDRCPTCGTRLVELGDLARPGAARLAGTALGALLIGPEVARSVATLADTSPPPLRIEPAAEPQAEEAQPVEDVVLIDGTEAGPSTDPGADHEATVAEASPDAADGATIAEAVQPEPGGDQVGFLGLDQVSSAPAPTAGPPVTEAPKPVKRGRKPKRSATAEERKEKLRTAALGVALLAVVAYVGVQTLQPAERQAPRDATLSSTEPPPSLLGPEDLRAAAADQVATVATDACGTPVTGTGFLLDPTHVITTRAVGTLADSPAVTVAGTTTTGTLIGWSWSPDLAVIELDEPVGDTPEITLPVTEASQAAEFDELVVVAPDGTTTTVAVTGLQPGWAGADHAVAVTGADLTGWHGAPVLTGAGELVGMLAAGPGGSVVVSMDVLTPAAADLIRAPSEAAADCAVTAAPDPASRWTGTQLGTVPQEPGTDPVLNELWDDCAAGAWAACDTLRFVADPGSPYAEFGRTCGSRVPDDGTACSLRIDLVAPGAVGAYRVGDCLVLPRSPAGVARPITCQDQHDAQAVHLVTVQGLTTDDAGAPVVTDAVVERVGEACAPALTALTDERFWDRPLESGVSAPARIDGPFVCFVYQPGVALEGRLQ